MGKRGNQHQEANEIAVGEWIGTAQGDSGEVVRIENYRGERVLVYCCEQTGRLLRCGLDSCYWVASPTQLAEFMRQKAIERNGQPAERHDKREYVREPLRDVRSRRPSNVGYV